MRVEGSGTGRPGKQLTMHWALTLSPSVVPKEKKAEVTYTSDVSPGIVIVNCTGPARNGLCSPKSVGRLPGPVIELFAAS